MRLPAINWTKVGEHLAAADPYAYAALLMDDGSIQTSEGQLLVAQPESADSVDRHERYDAWCRRAGRAVHPVPAMR
ncbi:MAG: hypothetical protein WAL22_14190 [Solirubrobacteraceae bacterium]